MFAVDVHEAVIAHKSINVTVTVRHSVFLLFFVCFLLFFLLVGHLNEVMRFRDVMCRGDGGRERTVRAEATGTAPPSKQASRCRT